MKSLFLAVLASIGAVSCLVYSAPSGPGLTAELPPPPVETRSVAQIEALVYESTARNYIEVLGEKGFRHRVTEPTEPSRVSRYQFRKDTGKWEFQIFAGSIATRSDDMLIMGNSFMLSGDQDSVGDVDRVALKEFVSTIRDLHPSYSSFLVEAVETAKRDSMGAMRIWRGQGGSPDQGGVNYDNYVFNGKSWWKLADDWYKIAEITLWISPEVSKWIISDERSFEEMNPQSDLESPQSRP